EEPEGSGLAGEVERRHRNTVLGKIAYIERPGTAPGAAGVLLEATGEIRRAQMQALVSVAIAPAQLIDLDLQPRQHVEPALPDGLDALAAERHLTEADAGAVEALHGLRQLQADPYPLGIGRDEGEHRAGDAQPLLAGLG